MARKTRGIILAAGLGTRLRPLTYFRAKPAVPFLNRPLISYSLEFLRKSQIDEIVVNLHYLPETVKEAVARLGSAKIRFSLEEEILGTAGCLVKVREFLGQDRFVVSNGKTYFEQDLEEVLELHERSGAMVTMVLVPYTPGDPYQPVYLDFDGNVVGFARNRPQHLEAGFSSCHRLAVYTGVQVLEPDVLDWIPSGTSDSVNEIYPELIRQGYHVKGFVSSSYWCECSTLGGYLTNSLEVLRLGNKENLSSVGLPAGCRGAILGDRVQVQSDTVIRNSVMWGDIRLGRDSSFYNVIITEGVHELPSGTHLRNVVVTPLLEGLTNVPGATKVDGRYMFWPLD